MSSLVVRRTVLRVAAAGLAAVSVAACDDSGSDATAGSPSAAASAGGAPTAATATAVAPSGTTSAGGKVVAATDLCAFLQKKLPEWRAVDGENGAQAQLAIDLFTFYQEKGAVPVGRDVDAETRAQCPTVRAEVLKAAGISDFLIL